MKKYCKIEKEIVRIFFNTNESFVNNEQKILEEKTWKFSLHSFFIHWRERMEEKENWNNKLNIVLLVEYSDSQELVRAKIKYQRMNKQNLIWQSVDRK